MTLFKIAFRNIRKNSYDYLMYFFSMAFAIMIYYSFACIKYNDSFAAAIGASQNLSSAFSAATFIMTLFSIIFIWYSNMFFTKKRKKEFGLYSLMGVKKKHIGRMYFYETIFIGILAILTGILLGTFFSKFFTMILVKVIRYDMNVKFFFSWKQLIETITVFIIIFIVVSLQGYYIAFRYKLIDLFNSDRKKERVPKSSVCLAVLSLALIIGSYIMSHTYFFIEPVTGFFGTLALAIIGTYIFFRHFILFGINIIKKRPKYYYKNVNMISTSLLFYRVKSNYRTLATIAIMSAVTLTTIGTSYSFYYKSFNSAKSSAPFALMYEKKDTETDNKVLDILTSQGHKITYSDEISLLETTFTIDFNDEEGLLNNYRPSHIPAAFISESDYKKTSAYLKSFHDYDLNKGEVVWFMKTYTPQFEVDYSGLSMHTDDLNQEFLIKNFAVKPLLNDSTARNLFLVSDEVYATLKKDYIESYHKMIDFTNADDSKKASIKLAEYLSEMGSYSMFYPDYASTIASTGLFVYIAGFLGVVFLIATGTIIFFKQLTEANEDWQKYLTLDKIGVTTSEMKLIVKKQMRLIFGAPLILGIIHASFAIDVLAQMLGSNLVKPVILSFSAYLIIYILFYFLTCSAYYKIIHSYKTA